MNCCPTCGAKIVAPEPTPPSRSEDPVWRAFIEAWWSRYGPTPVPARELHQLPEGRAIRPSISAFGQSLGKAWRAGDVVNGRRVVLNQWGYTKARKKGRNVVIPTMWALEEVQP